MTAQADSVRGGVVVTGGGRGIGAAVAGALSADHHVVVLDVDSAMLELTEHPNIQRLTGSVLETEDLDRACAAAVAGGGRLVGFVANAGYNRPGPSASLERQAWDEVVAINLGAVFESARAAQRHASGGLSIVAISSYAGYFGLAGRAAYSAAKAGVAGMIRSLAVEWADQGIRVNGVAPGFIATTLLQKAIDAGTMSPGAMLARTPLGRLGDPAEVAQVVRFLLTEASSYVTGTVIAVDGGAGSLGLPVDDRELI